MSEAEIIGGVVLALATLIGLFFTVAKPLTANTKQMTELSMQIKNLSALYERHEKEFDKQVAHNSEAHKRIWEKNEEQDEKLDDHEKRIRTLEGK